MITIARVQGLAAGSQAADTPGRLSDAPEAGKLSEEAADMLTRGYEMGMGLRLHHQLGQWRRREPLDNRVDFSRLGEWERKVLTTVFGSIEQVQGALAVSYPVAHLR